jgi:hypothetical protein
MNSGMFVTRKCCMLLEKGKTSTQYVHFGRCPQVCRMLDISVSMCTLGDALKSVVCWTSVSNVVKNMSNDCFGLIRCSAYVFMTYAKDCQRN